MSIKPIDFQVMMPKMAEAAKITSDANQRNDAHQLLQNSLLQHKVENTTRQVYSQDMLHGAKIREKRKQEQQEQKKKNRMIYSKNKESDEGIETSTIDVRL